jgi:DNA-binding transcriptional LysR family regulator
MTESPPEASARALQQLPHALRKLRIRDLELLCLLARTRSFARTAESGAMTQPALSKWLREIEHSLDVSLFARTTRRVAPTVFGEALVECAERVLTDLSGVTPTMQALRSGLGQPVNVGVLHGVASVLMPNVLARMERDGPPPRVNLWDDTFDRLLPRLHWREIDMLVCRLDANALNSGFDAIPLYEDDVYVLGGPKHPLAREAKPSWADAACYPWIVAPRNTPMRNTIETTFAHHGIAMPTVIMESSSLMTNAATARMLPCLFLSSKLVVQKSPYSNALHHFGLRCHQFEGTVGVLHNPNPSTAALCLIEIMQSVAHSIASPSSCA